MTSVRRCRLDATRAQRRSATQHPDDKVARRTHAQERPDDLTSWKAIAEYLGQPLATVQRWGKSGMPVHRQGRFTVASREELSRWLGRATTAGAPVHLAAANESDLTSELRAGLSAVRHKPRKPG